MILVNGRVKFTDFTRKVGISKRRVHHKITDILGYRKVSARWVLRMLIDKMKVERRTCAKLLHKYEEEIETFFQQIVTRDNNGCTIMTQRANGNQWDTDTRTDDHPRNSKL
ncbi:histone-lysine N-methyltransferase SETMAR [Plakobranchus ocellatus]|uniref:Histone-lysine N-methyltransferase SETMAR n=1 Tax=Plakobranchus ocellatus TaxID=259542 RepID=A0AAV4AB34_9GAST|nr:histone-lysine N-methyltransferase SETMAR [Plakobranchus ocellatus]